MSQATSVPASAAGAESDLFYRIAMSVAGEVGTELLAALVRSMRDVMDVGVAMITRGIGEPPVRARASWSWRRQGSHDPIEYDLEGTPCQLVYQGRHLLVPKALWQQFPREVGWEGYCGVPLKDRSGKVIGHFAVLSEAPIGNPERTEGLMRIFGLRAEAELQRIEYEHEREQLVERLSRALERLGAQHQANRRANAFKTEMLGMVAHDLRNPLASIVTRVELIEALAARAGDAEPDDKVMSSCHAIVRSADRMEKMIADLLVSARNEAQTIALTCSEIDVADPVRAAIGLNHAAAEKKRLRIVERLEPGRPITADEDRLIEAIDNLLSNAVKYSAPGGTITVATRTDSAGLALVSIADEGQGLSAEDLAQAFQPFQPLSARPTGGEASTGLGLAIVKAIAEAHGGSVAAESPGKGQGSTFTIRLPIAGPA
jgi:signal transduction histidine kinase